MTPTYAKALAGKPDRRLILLGMGMLPLTACSTIFSLPGQGPRPEVFDLRGAIPQTPATGPKFNLQLGVLEPAAANGLNIDRIAVRPVARRIDYYANALWTDRAPAMLQSLLLQSLNATGRIAAARVGALAADVNLRSELDAFDAIVEGGGPPRIEIAWRFELVRPMQGRVAAVRVVSESEQAAGTDVPAVVQAYEAALRRALSEAVAFVFDELPAFKL